MDSDSIIQNCKPSYSAERELIMVNHKGKFSEKVDIDLTARPRTTMKLPSKKLTDTLERNNSIIFPEQKVCVCGIPKNCLTQLRQLQIQYLTGERMDISIWGHQLLVHNPTVTLDESGRSLFAKYKNQLTTRDWETYIFVRDPLERLISAYLHLCVWSEIYLHVDRSEECYFCKRYNVTCFLQRNSEWMRSVRDPRKSAMNDISDNNLRHHFYPQYWYCGLPGARRSVSIVRISEDNQKFSAEVRANLPSLRLANDSINSMAFKDKPAHNTKQLYAANRIKIRNHILNEENLWQAFYDTYHGDYATFGFQVKCH